jgi:geranylgeranyl diphosphate synthase type 3
MVKDKTGGLFRLAVGLMLPFSDFNIRYPEIDLSILLDLMSLYFQIRDDFLNLSRYDIQ